MPSNRGPGKVEVQEIDFPRFSNPAGKQINHGVIPKVVATNICGSDQHMVRGRTTAPVGMVLGHGHRRSSRSAVTSNITRSAISYRFRSMWLAAAAAIVARATPVSA